VSESVVVSRILAWTPTSSGTKQGRSRLSVLDESVFATRISATVAYLCDYKTSMAKVGT